MSNGISNERYQIGAKYIMELAGFLYETSHTEDDMQAVIDDLKAFAKTRGYDMDDPKLIEDCQTAQRWITTNPTAEQHLAWALEDEAEGDHEAAKFNRAAAAALGGA